MIEYDMINYLESDATLMTLLGVTGDDKKIYPDKPPTRSVIPYILYFWGVGDQGDEILDEDRIQLTMRANTKQVATNIRDRLKVLLDKQDEIQDTTFHSGSTLYYIYYCRITGGSGFWDSVPEIYNIIMFFNVKYKKKV